MNKLEIQTDRLMLRLIEWADVEVIHRLHSLPETDEFNTLGIPENLQETHEVITPWIEANNVAEIRSYTFAIQHKNKGEFIGLFGLRLGPKKYNRAEVWYKLHLDYWNKGYATEALKAVLKYGFDVLKLHRIEAGCAVDNIGSAKVMEKVGMLKEGRKRKILPLQSGWSDSFEYAIVEGDVRN
ncbi:GNAT family N-acetyltransferase [Maribacter aquivivus]|uniref:GNAT family N-acetyltransferase n=1 Tax=Maribacter aquivivus TaxID=228958 RepID=UPI0024902475|nr:GNAT family N-acetyltransferase [Maribacter aquivivus]